MAAISPPKLARPWPQEAGITTACGHWRTAWSNSEKTITTSASNTRVILGQRRPWMTRHFGHTSRRYDDFSAKLSKPRGQRQQGSIRLLLGALQRRAPGGHAWLQIGLGFGAL